MDRPPLAAVIRPKEQKPLVLGRESDKSPFLMKQPLAETALRPETPASDKTNCEMEEEIDAIGAKTRHHPLVQKWFDEMREFEEKTRAGKPRKMEREELYVAASVIQLARTEREKIRLSTKFRIECKTGDEVRALESEAKEKVLQIIACNWRFAAYYTRHLLESWGFDVAELKRNGNILDYYQAAMLGTAKAALEYSAQFKCTFPTYARFWIKKFVIETGKETLDALSISTYAVVRAKSLEAAIDCISRHGPNPGEEHIAKTAETFKMHPNTLRKMLKRISSIEKADDELSERRGAIAKGRTSLSLDEPLSEGIQNTGVYEDQNTLHEVLPGTDGSEIQDRLISSLALGTIQSALKRLPVIQRRIITLAYLHEEGPKSDDEVAALLSEGTKKCLLRQRVTDLRQQAELILFKNRRVRATAEDFGLEPGETRGAGAGSNHRAGQAEKQRLLDELGDAVSPEVKAHVMNDPIGPGRLERNLRAYAEAGIDPALVPAHRFCVLEKKHLETSVNILKGLMQKSSTLEKYGVPEGIRDYVMNDPIKTARLERNLELLKEAGIDLCRASGYDLCRVRDLEVTAVIRRHRNPVKSRESIQATLRMARREGILRSQP